MSINDRQIRQAEEALYMHKYLFGRISALQIEIESIVPTMPGSVLKMVGRPVAKTPMDTSETERWGIIRATCKEGIEICAKEGLKKKLDAFKKTLSKEELNLIKELYDREQRPARVRERLNLSSREYYTIRQRILRKLWPYIEEVEDVFEIAVK